MKKMIENEVNNFRTELVETAEGIIQRGMNDYDWLSVEEYLITIKTNMEYLERIIQVNIEEYKDKEIVPYSLYTRNNKLIKLINDFREGKVEGLKGYMAILEECMNIIRLNENNLI
jgi:hypothetical protein